MIKVTITFPFGLGRGLIQKLERAAISLTATIDAEASFEVDYNDRKEHQAYIRVRSSTRSDLSMFILNHLQLLLKDDSDEFVLTEFTSECSFERRKKPVPDFRQVAVAP